jgi:hypothetical protein
VIRDFFPSGAAAGRVQSIFQTLFKVDIGRELDWIKADAHVRARPPNVDDGAGGGGVVVIDG